MVNVYDLELPPGIKVEGIYPHGASYWTRTAKIVTEHADGSPKSYFIKVSIDGRCGRGPPS